MSERKHRSAKVRDRIWRRFDKTCQLCFRPTDERGFDLDHHIPLAIGGEDTEDNLRPLCIPCHRLKTRGDQGTIAKTRRQANGHVGAKAPSRHPIPGSRNTPYRKRMNGSVELRHRPASHREG